MATQIFFLFTPIIWGRWTHFDEHIFQIGWFNHQPANLLGPDAELRSANWFLASGRDPRKIPSNWALLPYGKYVSFVHPILLICCWPTTRYVFSERFIYPAVCFHVKFDQWKLHQEKQLWIWLGFRTQEKLDIPKADKCTLKTKNYMIDLEDISPKRSFRKWEQTTQEDVGLSDFNNRGQVDGGEMWPFRWMKSQAFRLCELLQSRGDTLTLPFPETSVFAVFAPEHENLRPLEGLEIPKTWSFHPFLGANCFAVSFLGPCFFIYIHSQSSNISNLKKKRRISKKGISKRSSRGTIFKFHGINKLHGRPRNGWNLMKFSLDFLSFFLGGVGGTIIWWNMIWISWKHIDYPYLVRLLSSHSSKRCRYSSAEFPFLLLNLMGAWNDFQSPFGSRCDKLRFFSNEVTFKFGVFFQWTIITII